MSLLITRALSPAHITSLTVNEERKQADAFLQRSEVSLAIGKGGYNIRLASQLTGYKIDVFCDSEGDMEDDDVLLEEFSNEIESWIIDSLKRIGCTTARNVLDLQPEEIVQRADLEEETVAELLEVLRRELE